LVFISVFVAASAVAVPSVVLAQERGQVIKAAPIFVAPDANRTPLTVAKVGTRLTVVSVEKEWYLVEWQDPQWGRRVGFVRAEFVLLDRQRAQEPKAAPVPPTPTIPTPPQVTLAKAPVSKAGRRMDRGYISVSGIYQTGAKAFAESFTFDQYAEVAHVTTSYPKLEGPGFDAGGGIRLWRNLAAGAAVSYFTKTGTAAVDASIPHPFYFNQDRTISGSFSPSRRTELAVHVQAAFMIPAGRKVLVTVAGGPSIFNVRQSLVTGVQFSESYPFDTAEFTSADSEEVSKSAVGFNVGIDVAYYFSRTIGVGGLVRYATARVPLGGKSGSLKVDAGGFQAGVGLRVRIPAGPTKPQPPKPTKPIPPKR
jgi:hypothetical protein